MPWAGPMATSIVFSRIPDKKLPDSKPQEDLRKCNVSQLVNVTSTELDLIRKRYRVLVQNLLFQHFPAFEAFKPSSPQTTYCACAENMSQKSETVTMPVLMKDEKKYAECVDVLDQLEDWTYEIYSAAGLCHTTSSPESDPSTLPSVLSSSRPDQPASHVPPSPSDDDPLRGIKIPCFGDQLTRVRLAGAKDLRAGCHTAKQRFHHLYPFCIVDWHTKRSFLKTVFKRLYRNSGREKGTIRYFREKLNRRNVTADIKHFEDCEQLFFSIGKCYVIEALLEFFQMADAKQKPMENAPNSLDEEQNDVYIITTIDKFLDEFVFFNNDQHDENDRDGVSCYAINLLRSFLLLADFKDAVQTGNGEHLSTLRKQLLIHFFSTPGYNEFAIEMLINILQCQVLLSEAEAHHCKWAATVNWNGGFGKNIEIDLFQENQNAEMKKLIRSMGPNKSEQAISRASKACGGVKKIVESFDEQASIHRKSSTHSHRTAAKDEAMIQEDLRDLRPFKKVCGREFESFQGISSNPIQSFDNAKFQIWIERHKRNILLHYPDFGDEAASDESEEDY